MKVLIDTNIILDVLYAREPFAEDASKIFKFCELKRIYGYVSALSIPNIVYVMRKEMDRKKTMLLLEKNAPTQSATDLEKNTPAGWRGCESNQIPVIILNSSSLMIFIPRSFALSSLDPASSPQRR